MFVGSGIADFNLFEDSMEPETNHIHIIQQTIIHQTLHNNIQNSFYCISGYYSQAICLGLVQIGNKN